MSLMEGAQHRSNGQAIKQDTTAILVEVRGSRDLVVESKELLEKILAQIPTLSNSQSSDNARIEQWIEGCVEDMDWLTSHAKTKYQATVVGDEAAISATSPDTLVAAETILLS